VFHVNRAWLLPGSDEEDGLQVRRSTVNILHKEWRTTDKSWPFRLDEDRSICQPLITNVSVLLNITQGFSGTTYTMKNGHKIWNWESHEYLQSGRLKICGTK
jgi:hypothetical protein